MLLIQTGATRGNEGNRRQERSEWTRSPRSFLGSTKWFPKPSSLSIVRTCIALNHEAATGFVLQAQCQQALLAFDPRVLSSHQEKERNAKRKKKKAPAAQNEEAAFTPAAEDEEMEVSGISGNEEEMAEEAEGEALRATIPVARISLDIPGVPLGSWLFSAMFGPFFFPHKHLLVGRGPCWAGRAVLVPGTMRG